MILRDIINGIKPIEVIGQTDIDINQVEIDSRKAKPGSLFVAMRGTQTDGHQYIGKAIERVE